MLRDAALKVQKNAYAPYSKFQVGVAIKSENGHIFSGVNVENVAYPEGTCAEAGAIAAMIAAGESKIIEVYVIANGPRPVPPCGGCRQKIAEFADPDVVVTLSNLFGDEEKQESAILIIKQGLVDHTLVSDPEINLAATMIRLSRMK